MRPLFLIYDILHILYKRNHQIIVCESNEVLSQRFILLLRNNKPLLLEFKSFLKNLNTKHKNQKKIS